MRRIQFFLALTNFGFSLYLFISNLIKMPHSEPFSISNQTTATISTTNLDNSSATAATNKTSQVNTHTFFWTLFYITLAISILHLYFLYMTNKLDDWYDLPALKGIRNFSIVAALVNFVASCVYFGIAYRKLNSIDWSILSLDSTLISIVASFLNSLVLYSSTRKFEKYIILCKPPSDDFSSSSALREPIIRYNKYYQAISNQI